MRTFVYVKMMLEQFTTISFKYSISTPSSYFMTPQLTLPKTITETAIYYILLTTEKFLNSKKGIFMRNLDFV